MVTNVFDGQENNSALRAQDLGYLGEFVKIFLRNASFTAFYFADHKFAFRDRCYINLVPMVA